MNLLKKINLVLLVLLGGAAGFAKVTQAPPEVAFFAGLGLGAMVVIVFGVLQIAGALSLIFAKTRFYWCDPVGRHLQPFRRHDSDDRPDRLCAGFRSARFDGGVGDL